MTDLQILLYAVNAFWKGFKKYFWAFFYQIHKNSISIGTNNVFVDTQNFFGNIKEGLGGP